MGVLRSGITEPPRYTAGGTLKVFDTSTSILEGYENVMMIGCGASIAAVAIAAAEDRANIPVNGHYVAASIVRHPVKEETLSRRATPCFVGQFLQNNKTRVASKLNVEIWNFIKLKYLIIHDRSYLVDGTTTSVGFVLNGRNHGCLDVLQTCE